MRFFHKNSNFELGDRDWDKETGWTIQLISSPRSGLWGGQFTGTGTANLITPVLDAFPVRPGGKITASIFILSNAATAGNARVGVQWLDTNFAFISSAFGNSVAAFGNPVYVASILTDIVAPARAKFVRFRCEMSGLPAGTWRVDDFDASGDIIETIPASAIIRSHRLIDADTVGRFDPLVGSDKFSDFNAGMSDRWAFVYTFIPALGADLGELIAFIRRLGKVDRFFAFHPGRKTPLNGVVNGILIDGAVTQGTTRIPVRGGPVSTTALVVGDFMEVKDQYFRLQRDLEIGPAGTGEAIVWPAVRSTLGDGEDVITDNPKMVARITSDLDERQVEARPVEITISGEEV